MRIPVSLHHMARLGTTAAIAALAFTVSVTASAQMNDKWITIVTSAEPPDLDGCQSARQHQGRVIKYNVVETLVDRDLNSGELKPRLATSWSRVDPLTWRFQLRQGVKFHDDSPFNAENAKWSLERSLSTSLVCSDRNRAFNDLTAEFNVVSDYVLDVKTSRPEPILPLRMANMSIVGPETPLDANSLEPIGTGPYLLHNWDSGQEIVLRRNDSYWGAEPDVEGVRYIWRGDSSVRAAMVEIGEADIALGIAQPDADNPELDYSHFDSETLQLRLDTATPPLNDKRVREALNYALDREVMVGTVLPGSVMQATQLVVPTIPGHNHELDKAPKPYDPDKARQLLAEAKADGVPVDTELLLVAYPSNFPVALELMEAFFAMYRAVGLNIKMISVEPGQYSTWNNKPFPDPRPPYLLQSSHDNNNGDPVFTVIQKFGCAGASSGFCDPEFDKEVIRVSGLEDQARIDGWKEIFRKQYEEIIPDVPLYHMVGFTRVSKRIDYVPDISTNNEIRLQSIHFTQ